MLHESCCSNEKGRIRYNNSVPFVDQQLLMQNIFSLYTWSFDHLIIFTNRFWPASLIDGQSLCPGQMPRRNLSIYCQKIWDYIPLKAFSFSLNNFQSNINNFIRSWRFEREIVPFRHSYSWYSSKVCLRISATKHVSLYISLSWYLIHKHVMLHPLVQIMVLHDSGTCNWYMLRTVIWS